MRSNSSLQSHDLGAQRRELLVLCRERGLDLLGFEELRMCCRQLVSHAVTRTKTGASYDR